MQFGRKKSSFTLYRSYSSQGQPQVFIFSKNLTFSNLSKTETQLCSYPLLFPLLSLLSHTLSPHFCSSSQKDKEISPTFMKKWALIIKQTSSKSVTLYSFLWFSIYSSLRGTQALLVCHKLYSFLEFRMLLWCQHWNY